jgi:hypothetical protein
MGEVQLAALMKQPQGQWPIDAQPGRHIPSAYSPCCIYTKPMQTLNPPPCIFLLPILYAACAGVQ